MAQNVGKPAHLATNTTLLVRTGLGQLMTVTINTKGLTGNTLKIYDGVDGTGVLIANIDTTAALGSFLYDVIVAAGIFAEMATGTAADVTIVFG
jgi:hypothetical protein